MRARLLNPEWVTIHPVNRAATREDSLGGEPVGLVARSPLIRIKAQVDESATRNQRRPAQGGAQVQQGARLSFLWRDVTAAGWTPTDGDRVVKVESRDGTQTRTVNWYLSAVTTSGKEHHRARLVVANAGPRRDRVTREGL